LDLPIVCGVFEAVLPLTVGCVAYWVALVPAVAAWVVAAACFLDAALLVAYFAAFDLLLLGAAAAAKESLRVLPPSGSAFERAGALASCYLSAEAETA